MSKKRVEGRRGKRPLPRINTEQLSARLRSESLDSPNKRLLITKFHDTEQERDLMVPPNCEGLGRVRHFYRETASCWPSNPLPLDPAAKVLGLDKSNLILAQVFQNAACNWRCWYCFVPFNLLNANPKYSKWVTASELLDLYLSEPNPPGIIDLTGGQPDLVPEWVLWMIQEIKMRGLESQIYLWSDDNLSNDYFWRFLSETEREIIATYPSYGRVCCFKGFNEESFSFNTNADENCYDQQFSLMKRLITLGIDLYAYATFTSPSRSNIAEDMARFVDRLQVVDHNLPLRTVPLEVKIFTPVKRRLTDVHKEAMENQFLAIEAWQEELSRRFSNHERQICITNVPFSTSKFERAI